MRWRISGLARREPVDALREVAVVRRAGDAASSATPRPRRWCAAARPGRRGGSRRPGRPRPRSCAGTRALPPGWRGPARCRRPLARQDDHHGAGGLVVDPARRLDPVHAGHLQVHEHDVGLFLRGGLHGGLAVGDDLDHAEVLLLVERHLQRFAERPVVVGDHDGDGPLGSRLRHTARIVGPDLGCFTHLKQVAGEPGHGYRARVNPAAEGTTYPDMPFVVTPERVAGFRELFGLAQGVPPTIPRRPSSRCSPRSWPTPGWTSISRAWCTDRRSTRFARAPREG